VRPLHFGSSATMSLTGIAAVSVGIITRHVVHYLAVGTFDPPSGIGCRGTGTLSAGAVNSLIVVGASLPH
jgi:hypothetical protein